MSYKSSHGENLLKRSGYDTDSTRILADSVCQYWGNNNAAIIIESLTSFGQSFALATLQAGLAGFAAMYTSDDVSVLASEPGMLADMLLLSIEHVQESERQSKTLQLQQQEEQKEATIDQHVATINNSFSTLFAQHPPGIFQGTDYEKYASEYRQLNQAALARREAAMLPFSLEQIIQYTYIIQRLQTGALDEQIDDTIKQLLLDQAQSSLLSLEREFGLVRPTLPYESIADVAPADRAALPDLGAADTLGMIDVGEGHRNIFEAYDNSLDQYTPRGFVDKLGLDQTEDVLSVLPPLFDVIDTQISWHPDRRDTIQRSLRPPGTSQPLPGSVYNYQQALFLLQRRSLSPQPAKKLTDYDDNHLPDFVRSIKATDLTQPSNSLETTWHSLAQLAANQLLHASKAATRDSCIQGYMRSIGSLCQGYDEIGFDREHIRLDPTSNQLTIHFGLADSALWGDKHDPDPLIIGTDSIRGPLPICSLDQAMNGPQVIGRQRQAQIYPVFGHSSSRVGIDTLIQQRMQGDDRADRFAAMRDHPYESNPFDAWAHQEAAATQAWVTRQTSGAVQDAKVPMQRYLAAYQQQDAALGLMKHTLTDAAGNKLSGDALASVWKLFAADHTDKGAGDITPDVYHTASLLARTYYALGTDALNDITTSLSTITEQLEVIAPHATAIEDWSVRELVDSARRHELETEDGHRTPLSNVLHLFVTDSGHIDPHSLALYARYLSEGRDRYLYHQDSEDEQQLPSYSHHLPSNVRQRYIQRYTALDNAYEALATDQILDERLEAIEKTTTSPPTPSASPVFDTR